jgi:alkylation response protein AidB-like acyl-CoA dehydrogenase
MEIGYTEEQESLRRELRDYYSALLTPEVEEQLANSHGIGPDMRRVVKQMAQDGWLGIGWPEEDGGQGRTPIEQFIFFDESMLSGARCSGADVGQEQRDFCLPKILAGDEDQAVNELLMTLRAPEVAVSL